jgi:putative ABC transport system permease protein
MNILTRGIRNAFRNTIRTISIVVIVGLSIGLALTMLVAHQAVQREINTIKSSAGNTVTISPAGVRGFTGGGNPLTETQLAAVKTLPHVTSVTESISDRLTTSNSNLVSAISAGSLGQRFAQNNGESFTFRGGGSGGAGGSGGGAPSVTTNFTPPVTVVGTDDPTNLNLTQGGGTFTLKSGSVFADNSSANVALVGTTLASKNNLKVGSTFTAYNTTITVAGIFDAGNTFSNNQVIMPLTTVQTLSSQPNDVTSAIVNVDSIGNVASVATAATKTLGSAADVTNSVTDAQTKIAQYQSIQTISLYSLIGAVIAGAVIILLVMIMIVRERRREIGVYKAIGASNIRVMLQFMIESVTFTVLGAIVGLILGVTAGSPVTNILVKNASSSTTTTGAGGFTAGGVGFTRRLGGGFGQNGIRNIHAAVGWDILLYGLGAAVIIAIVGSAVASLLIAKVRPAEVMRAE